MEAKLVLFSLSWESSLTMYGVVPKRMVAVLANHNGTNWISATIDEGSLGEGIIIG